ncbi:class I tRNA ligase family protein [Escherichia coli]
MKGKAPYRQVLTHGFTVDGQGRKMSKSIGNTVSPQEATNKLGADILRLWVASTDYTGELPFLTKILKRAADSYRRIRNTARFLLQTDGFDPAKDMVKPEEMVVLDPLGRRLCESGTGRHPQGVRSIRFPRSGTASDALLLR